MNSTKPTRAQPGSVSSGTMLAGDLIPAFLHTLTSVVGRYSDPDLWDRIEAVRREWVEQFSKGKMRNPSDSGVVRYMWPMDRGDEETRDEQIGYLLNEDLFDLMDAIAPPGHYFGAHPGDGADYGFWRSDEFDPDLFYTVGYVQTADGPDVVTFCGACIVDTHHSPLDEHVEEIAEYGECDQCGRVEEPCTTCNCSDHADSVHRAV